MNENKVLIVEDDHASLVLLEAFVTELGYDVATAMDGEEAFELVQAGDFRIVISDWEMPRLDGVELCRRIRKRQFGSYVYFILLTGREREDDLVEGLKAGADDFLTKPFHPEELRFRLRGASRVVALEGRDVFIFSLASLAESRDSETGEHLERMREYSRILAQDLARTDKYRGEINGDYIRSIYLASPLHDIGKVGIPDAILLKPGRLTREEFEVMKQHTTIGGKTLARAMEHSPSADFFRFAQEIALTHHERYDGRGYPDGLAGDEIPLCGRIVAVADVYDALTSVRIYKDAYSHEAAKRIIISDSGTAFDPDVVDAFLRCETQFAEVKHRYRLGVPQHAASPALAWD